MLFATGALIASLSNAFGLVTISNWVLTETSIAFDISGTLSASKFPDGDTHNLFFGEVGNADWIISTQAGSFGQGITGSVDGRTTLALTLFSHSAGDAVVLQTSSAAPYNFTDLTGNQVNVSVSKTFNDPVFIPSAFDFDQISFSWGLDTGFTQVPDPANILQAPAPVPEPSTLATLAGLIAAIGILRRHRRIG